MTVSLKCFHYLVLKHKYLCFLSSGATVLRKKISVLCSCFTFKVLSLCPLISLGRDCRKWSADLLPVFKSSLRTFNLFYLIFLSQFAAQCYSQLPKHLCFRKASATCFMMVEIWVLVCIQCALRAEPGWTLGADLKYTPVHLAQSCSYFWKYLVHSGYARRLNTGIT